MGGVLEGSFLRVLVSKSVNFSLLSARLPLYTRRALFAAW